MVQKLECDVCHAVLETREHLGGHRSGHTRAKSAPARVWAAKSNGVCKDCGQTFKTSYQLGGHRRMMHRPFESTKSDTAKKSRMIIEQGHACEVCKLGVWMQKKIPLHLDHIDGNPTNQVRENLRLICPNCHAQTETYCGRNIGRPKCANREKAKYPLYRSKKWIDASLASEAQMAEQPASSEVVISLHA